MKKYSFKKGLKKSLVAFVLFGIPFLLNVLPSDVLNLTVGGVLALLYNFVKTKYL